MTWLDAIERIDMVLLEIIHLQTTIIHGLRTESLYRILRYEEHYLWGKYRPEPQSGKSSENGLRSNDWFSVLDAFRNSPYKLALLAGFWVPAFPYPRDVMQFGGRKAEEHEAASADTEFTPFYDASARKEALEAIKEIVPSIYDLSEWSADARRHYHILCTLQDLKANILRDKLVLCLAGHDAFNLFYRNKMEKLEKRLLARLIIVRSSVMRRLEEHLELVGNLIGQFEKSLDLSLHQDPRPTIERRREQGFYNSFLAERTLEIQADLTHLLNRVDEAKRDRARDTGGHPPASVTLRPARVMHSWQHNYTSSTNTFKNEVQESSRGEPQDRSNTDFVSSSFYMPERPDLQPTLSHELAHNAIKRRYEDFYSPPFDAHDDSFARLIKRIEMSFTYFNVSAGSFYSETQGVLLEIGTDLLASAVSGPAYLFASVLELIGESVEYLFELPCGNSLDLDLTLAERVSIPHEQAPIIHQLTWYVRLRVLCMWLEKIDPAPSLQPLTNTLIEGTRGLLEIFIDHVGTLLPDQRPWLHYWRELAAETEKHVARAPVCVIVRHFRAELTGKKRLTSLPRYHRRLPELVQDHLIQELLVMKSRPRRLLENVSEANWRSVFVRAYLGRDTDSAHMLKDTYQLLRDLHDIPWQCALINARDYLGPLISHGAGPASESRTSSLRERPELWLETMHKGSAMGKELYQFAFEFAFWQNQSPKDRMGAAIRAVQGILKHKTLPSLLRCRLMEWSDGTNVKELCEKARHLTQQISAEMRSGHAREWPEAVYIQHLMKQIQDIEESVDNPNSSRDDTAKRFKELQRCLRELLIESNSPEYDWIEKDIVYGEVSDFLKIVYVIAEKDALKPQDIKTNYERGLISYPAKAVHKAHPSRTASLFAGGTNTTNPLQEHQWAIARIVDKAEGYKLQQLNRILDLGRSSGADLPASWEELRSYISIHEKFNKSAMDDSDASCGNAEPSSMLRPFNVFADLEDESGSASSGSADSKKGRSRQRSIQLFNLSRFGLAEPLKIDALSKEGVKAPSDPMLLRLMRHSQWSQPGVAADGEDGVGECRYQTVMGRFDLLSLERCRPLHRGALFHFKDEDKSEEFPPHFRRQEIAIPFRLHKEGYFCRHYEKEYEIFAALPILLTQRTARLHFVYRLWQIAENVNSSFEEGKYDPPKSLGGIRFSKEDRGFIGEGWGDIIILFGKMRNPYNNASNVSSDDVLRVMDIQDVIYEDFLVDRTELVFMSSALGAAALDLEQRFTVSIDVRLEEDRKSLRVNKMTRDAYDSRVAEYWDAEKLTGPMDYRFTLKKPPTDIEIGEGTGWLVKTLGGMMGRAEFVSSHISRKLSPVKN